MAFAFLTAMAFSTVPTPLYPLYQARDGFSSLTVSFVFGIYVIGVIASLVLAGHLSDWHGRKRLLVPALALEILVSIGFILGHGLAVLVVGRLLSGLGIGLIAATATAHLHDLHQARGGDDQGSFERVSAAANLGGLGIGALIAGALAQFVGQPLRVPYAVFTVLLTIGLVGVLLTPETVEVLPEPPRYRPQRLAVGHGATVRYLAGALAAFTAFAVFGLFSSLAPGFIAVTLQHPSRLLAGATAFLVFAAAVVAQAATARWSASRRFGWGLLGQAAGLGVLAWGMESSDLALFLIGGVLAGAGAGILFKAALGMVVGMAAPANRGEALAGLFLIAYLGLVLPVLGVGVATQFIAELTAMLCFVGFLLVVVALAGFLLSAAAGAAGEDAAGRRPMRVASRRAGR